VINNIINYIYITIKYLSYLYVCMAIKHIIVLFVETARKFITAKLSIRKPGSIFIRSSSSSSSFSSSFQPRPKPGSSSDLHHLHLHHIISTDEDQGLRIESFAVINLRGLSTNKTIIIKYLSNKYISDNQFKLVILVNLFLQCMYT
jgi:hypothetical protein